MVLSWFFIPLSCCQAMPSLSLYPMVSLTSTLRQELLWTYQTDSYTEDRISKEEPHNSCAAWWWKCYGFVVALLLQGLGSSQSLNQLLYIFCIISKCTWWECKAIGPKVEIEVESFIMIMLWNTLAHTKEWFKRKKYMVIECSSQNPDLMQGIPQTSCNWKNCVQKWSKMSMSETGQLYKMRTRSHFC